MESTAIQDLYPPEFSHCYGCGRLNEDGLHIQSRWLDEGTGKTISRFTPRLYHIALPGFVYGGLLASLIDCHGTGSAALAAYHAEGRSITSQPANRFVTAALHVEFLRPTPLEELELIGEIQEVKLREGRTKKVVVNITLTAQGQPCVKGQVVAVQMPDNFGT